MSRLPITPTRGNLIRIKEEARFIREGFRLLDEKKRVLIGEIMKIVETAQKKRRELISAQKKIYPLFCRLQIQNGRRRLETENLSRYNDCTVKMLEKSFVGVIFPQITVTSDSLEKPAHSLISTPAVLDRFILQMKDYLKILFELIELETRLWRLAAELKKLLKRVNALENILIPNYAETIVFIEEVLEEIDREEFYLRKSLKRRKSVEQN